MTFNDELAINKNSFASESLEIQETRREYIKPSNGFYNTHFMDQPTHSARFNIKSHFPL